MLLPKNESSLEKKNVSPKDFVSREWKSSKKKENLVVRQNSVIKGYHEFHVRSHKDLRDANNDDSFSRINKSNLIVALCKIKGTVLG